MWSNRPSGGTNCTLYTSGDGITETLSDGTLNAIAPAISDAGDILWEEGPWSGNYDLMLRREGVTTPITNTPDPESAPTINNAGLMAWTKYTCWPSYDCEEVFFHDGTTLHQLTFGEPGERSQGPRLNRRGDVAWLFLDSRFGLFTWASQVMARIDGEIVPISAPDR